MEEKQVTIDGHQYKMDLPFMVLATQNPIEQEGTYALPEAQLDRFIFKIKLDYPNLEEEVEILEKHHVKTSDLFLDEIEGNLDEAGLTAFTEAVLPKLKETFPMYTIVVISHQTSLHNSGILDHMWLVERRNRRATLTVYPNYHRTVN
jgi:MoxR-like ATPase